jgi:hypothetical protein
MAESRLVPSNLLAGYRIRNLLPDQKLIVYHIWATSPSDAGCFEPDIAGWSGHLSITPQALIEALVAFSILGLIAQDNITGEIFIIDWFRFHKFDSAIRRNMLKRSVSKIQSKKLKDLVLEKINEIDTKIGVILNKSTTCDPKESKPNETKSACKHADDLPACVQPNEIKDEDQNPRRSPEIIYGVKCWLADDVRQTDKMVNDHGFEIVEMAVKKLIEKGVDTLPSKVGKELDMILREKALRDNNVKKFHTAGNDPKPKKSNQT